MTCDPCQYCMNIYDDSDPSVGLYGYGCMYIDNGGEEWEPGCGHPCPGFISINTDLEDQIAYEEEERWWEEHDRWLEERYRNDDDD